MYSQQQSLYNSSKVQRHMLTVLGWQSRPVSCGTYVSYIADLCKQSTNSRRKILHEVKTTISIHTQNMPRVKHLVRALSVFRNYRFYRYPSRLLHCYCNSQRRKLENNGWMMIGSNHLKTCHARNYINHIIKTQNENECVVMCSFIRCGEYTLWLQNYTSSIN